MITRNPSRNAVLAGDSVQADAAVSRRILRDHPANVEVVLLHEVQGHALPTTMKNNPVL